MIQRIQTIWLLISATFSGLMIPWQTLTFSGRNGELYLAGFSGLFRSENSGNQLLTRLYSLAVIILVILALSVVAIFLFKKRKIQRIVTLAVILLSLSLIIMLIFSTFSVIRNFKVEFALTLNLVFPIIIPVAAFLAYRGISKDEDLVKSYDRLR